eukprot:scaffold55589_cov57-Phaeocystis_antarctica.AAC.5
MEYMRHLHELRVGLWHARDVLGALHHTLYVRVRLARHGVAPRRHRGAVRRADRLEGAVRAHRACGVK